MKAMNLLLASGQAAIANILMGGTNDIDALVPELWAKESLYHLIENMVAPHLVSTNYKDELAKYGQTVNIDKPGTFEAEPKTIADSVTIQDADSEQIAVKLNQLVHVSVLLKDGEENMAFKELAEYHLPEMVKALARRIDRVVLGQYAQFLANSFGHLGAMTSSNAKDYILGVRNVMNKNLAHDVGRNLIWSPDGETAVLGTELFISAEKRGDGGEALRNASMGRILGFQHYQCQNMAAIGDCDKTASVALINMAGGAAKGTTSLVCDAGAAAIAAGSYITIAGDDTPLRVVSTTGGATPTAIVVKSPGLRTAVADNAIITKWGVGTSSAAYAAGYNKAIGYAGFTVEPQVGQMVTFGTDSTSAVYVVVRVDTTNNVIYLDRPLEAAVSSGGSLNYGPAGNYNFAFHKNAVTLVSRPLAAPRSGAGALSSTQSWGGFAIRATITYNGEKQGHLVTLDMLMGIKVLDEKLGAVVLG